MIEPTKSSIPRWLYIVLAIGLPLVSGVYGIHNLVAGYTERGVQQLFCTVVLLVTTVVGVFLIFPLCLSVPGYLVMIVWVIYEACTVTEDGEGRYMP